MTRSPVAKGSSVPAWPVRAPVRRRSSATTENDERPGGLSTRTTPAGLSARGGTLSSELASDEGGDVLHGRLAREAGRLAVAAAVRAASNRRHVELVDARPQRDPPRGTTRPWRLADEHGE